MVRLGRYELIRRIGVGGMAEVFLARRRGPGGVEKRLVVKRIRPERSRDPRFLDLFVREAQLSMSLSHENVVPMFDFGRAGDELFLVMDYVDGPNLGSVIAAARREQAPIPPILVAHIGFELCSGLTHAHSAAVATRDDIGIVHCDVTPQNVLLSMAGEVKLADFGVAAVLGAGDGKMRGTPAYMAPEQARGADARARADIFCLGVVLWEAAHLRRAREGSGEELLELARAGKVPPCDDSVPAEIRAAIERATALEPEDRFESALDFGTALDAFVLKTRASAEDRRPAERQLASYLERIFGDGPPRDSVTPEPPEGRVSTFLEDGISGLLADSSTERSIASTIIDPHGATGAPGSEAPVEDTGGEEAAAEPDADGPAGTASSHRRIVAAVAAAGALAGVALFALARDGVGSAKSGHPAPAERPIAGDPDPVDAALPELAPGSDAGPLEASRATPAADAGARVVRPSHPRDAPADRPAGALGTLRVQVTPWAKVTVVGQAARCDETPCKLQLPAGTHTLVLENPITGQSGTLEVEVEAGSESRVSTVLR